MCLTTLLSFALSILLLIYNYLRLQILSHPQMRGTLARGLGLDVHWHVNVRDVCGLLFLAVCTTARTDVDVHPAAEFLGVSFSSCSGCADRKPPADFIHLTFLMHH